MENLKRGVGATEGKDTTFPASNKTYHPLRYEAVLLGNPELFMLLHFRKHHTNTSKHTQWPSTKSGLLVLDRHI